MLAELESNRLEVILVPEKRRTHEMGMIRCAVNRNCNWYRALCAKHPSSRGVRHGGFDTMIRRANVMRALNQMLRGVPAGKYEAELRGIARGLKRPKRDKNPF